MKVSDHFVQKLVNTLRDRKQTVTFAESCTGGLVCSRIVDISGSSDVFKRGFVTYCDDAKMDLLQVRRSTLDQYTAVSKQCAGEMAVGAAVVAKADAAVSVTGYADGMDSVGLNGLVYIGICYEGNVSVQEYHFSGTRNDVRQQACEQALQLLGKKLGL